MGFYTKNGGLIGFGNVSDKIGVYDLIASQVIGDALFAFTSFTFTSPNQDPFAPSSSDITSQTAYSNTTWASDTAYFNVQNGIQYFKIPASGTYRITAIGPVGKHVNGSAHIGYGGKVRGDFNLVKNDILAILVGQSAPTSNATTRYWQGGSGGTFVATVSSVGANTTATPLLVAGGGAAVRYTPDRARADANMSPNGKNGSGSNGGTQGSEAVGGGHNQTGGGGAAGWSGVGDAHGDTRNLYVPTGYPGNTTATAYLPARGFILSTSPGIGGIFNTAYDTTYRGSGGFGGGGPGGWGGQGGAGGYSGGGNDNNSSGGYGGGGGSFISSDASNVGTSTGSWSSGSGAYSGHSILASSSGLTNLGYNTNTTGSVILELL
jgi:hypothetical protein